MRALKEMNIELLDFNVPLNECLERNRIRGGSIGDSVLYYMQSSKNDINIDELPIDKYSDGWM